MKKDEVQHDELRPEYRRDDFGTMVRGKYAKQMQKGTNIIVLDPDVAEAFPNAQIVNETLRQLLKLGTNTPQTVSP